MAATHPRDTRDPRDQRTQRARLAVTLGYLWWGPPAGLALAGALLGKRIARGLPFAEVLSLCALVALLLWVATALLGGPQPSRHARAALRVNGLAVLGFVAAYLVGLVGALFTLGGSFAVLGLYALVGLPFYLFWSVHESVGAWRGHDPTRRFRAFLPVRWRQPSS